jgi:ribosomal protein L40E
VSISALGGGELLFPLWVWLIIIIVVAAAIAGFTIYTYKYGLGKYVECGECGAFIPAASKRCPKCGVEFEAGTMKCSECGAWIPAASTECPNCGVKFVGELEEEGDYLERMRAEYDEMVSKYRELARPELGKKFSDKAFDEWWRRQPGFITFDDWLAKEEEKKKEGPIPCPVCGTLNPKEATVCHKCGTVFGAARAGPLPERKAPPPGAPPAAGAPPAEAPEAAMPGAAPRMVIRRPIEKKVVPKKIIRTPSGQVIEEEPKEGENNQ